MQVMLEQIPDGMRLTARVNGPLTEGQLRWLEYEFNTLREGFDHRSGSWAFSCDENCFTATREFTGFSGWDSLLLWIRRTPEDIKRSREIAKELRAKGSKWYPEENEVELLPFELTLDGVPTSGEQLQKTYEAMPDQVRDLGEFKLSQPELLVSDPCYEPGTWCTGMLEARPGPWKAQSVVGPTDWYARTKQLRVWHESVSAEVFNDLDRFEDSGISAGVDSGQCGFFDAAAYRKVQEDEAEKELWYNKVCDITLDSGVGGGISPEGAGAVSQSGFGDGGYGVRVLKKRGKVVAAVLIYIGAEAEDEEMEDDEDLEESSLTPTAESSSTRPVLNS
jgi:hypothetical protein